MYWQFKDGVEVLSFNDQSLLHYESLRDKQVRDNIGDNVGDQRISFFTNCFISMNLLFLLLGVHSDLKRAFFWPKGGRIDLHLFNQTLSFLSPCTRFIFSAL